MLVVMQSMPNMASDLGLGSGFYQALLTYNWLVATWPQYGRKSDTILNTASQSDIPDTFITNNFPTSRIFSLIQLLITIEYKLLHISYTIQYFCVSRLDIFLAQKVNIEVYVIALNIDSYTFLQVVFET